ncbi:MAG: tail tape measure protein [Circular genetic element sp.]|nr:MAG: tail tape measure protein [Circular genetic element sp.]
MGLFGNIVGAVGGGGNIGAGIGGAVGSIVPGVGTAIGGIVGGLVGNLFGNKPKKWHAYEAPNTYITEISEATFNALRAMAPSAVVDEGKTFANIKLPKQIADQLRAELAGTTPTVALTPLNTTVTETAQQYNNGAPPKKDDGKIFGLDPILLFGGIALLFILKK